MSKKLSYLVVDTETTTHEWLKDICGDDEIKRKRVAIMRPLVYDIGWVITDRMHNVTKKASYLVAETFCTPTIFDNAYYADRKPQYLEDIKAGNIKVRSWNEIMDEFIADLHSVDFIGAYNAMFDERAIAYTDLYISQLYGNSFTEWDKAQKKICTFIANNPPKAKDESNFDNMNFWLRGESYPIFDIWGMACESLLNKQAYKNMCLDNGLLTASGEYFKTSAETSYRYLCSDLGFEEAHTALADAEIEAFILCKIVKRKAVTRGITYFPFRLLGYTDDYVTAQKNPERVRKAQEAMKNYVGAYEELETLTAYQKKIANKIETLEQYLAELEGN